MQDISHATLQTSQIHSKGSIDSQTTVVITARLCHTAATCIRIDNGGIDTLASSSYANTASARSGAIRQRYVCARIASLVDDDRHQLVASTSTIGAR
jgi:hypothetical protein